MNKILVILLLSFSGMLFGCSDCTGKPPDRKPPRMNAESWFWYVEECKESWKAMGYKIPPH